MEQSPVDYLVEKIKSYQFLSEQQILLFEDIAHTARLMQSVRDTLIKMNTINELKSKS